MGLGGGDQLARGAHSAQFEGPKVTQEKWDEAFPSNDGETEIERLRRKRIVASPEEQAQAEEVKQQESVQQQEIVQEKKTVPTSVPFRAVQDRIVIFRIEEEDEKVGSFFVPDEAKEKPAEGIVVAVGPGKFTSAGVFVPTSINVGDRVLFGKFAGQEVKVGLTVFLILREEDVFLVRT